MKFFLKVFLSISLIAFVFNLIDIEIIQKYIKKFSYSHFMIIFGLLLIQNIALSYRWLYLLKISNIKLNIFNLIRIQWSGLFFNQLMPSSFGGDIVRIILTKKLGSSVISVSTTIILERLIGLFVLCLISLFCMVFVDIFVEVTLKWIIAGTPVIIIVSLFLILNFD